MSHTHTTNLDLVLPEHRDPDTVESWDSVINGNMGIIDVAFGNRAAYSTVAQAPPASLASSDSHSQSLNKLAEAINGLPGAVSRSDILFPEYQGAVFTPSGTDNIGTMTSDKVDATNRYNYYEWLNDTEGTLQSYDISVKWQVPWTWSSWQSTALRIDICTEDTVLTNCKVDATICKDGALATTFPATPWATPVASSVAGTWGTQITFTSANLASLSLVAGSVLNILIRMYSLNYYVRVGNVTLSYVG